MSDSRTLGCNDFSMRFRLDFQHTLGRERSVRSFPEQRLLIEPTVGTGASIQGWFSLVTASECSENCVLIPLTNPSFAIK